MTSVTAQMLKAQKKVFRKNISVTLNQLSSSNVEEQSQAITSRVFALPAFKECASISCYLNMPTGEARTTRIAENILESGKTLFVPKIQKADGYMDFLRLYSPEDLASLPSGTWGIREPDDSWDGKLRASLLSPSSTDQLDIILVPGVAFDRTFSRLGHGKGYYDRFITSYVASGRPKPLLVGLGLREQLVDATERIPVGDHDWKMDIIITSDETLESPSPSSGANVA